MKDTVFNFGKNQILSGTLSSPENVSLASTQPCVVMLNSGLIPQAGPCRLHVDLARRFALQNLYSLRFDLSGVGDSEKHRDNRPYAEQITGDINAALNLIESETGITQFILFGICTGADNAHKTAVADTRIIGAVFLDGYAYKTPGYYLRLYGPRIFNPVKIFRGLFKLIKSLKQPATDEKTLSEMKLKQEQEKEDYYWTLPPIKQTLADLENLAKRNVQQLFVFTEAWDWCYNYPKQFYSMYKKVDFKNTAELLYFAKADHTFTLVSDRNKLMDSVCDWVQKKFQSN